MPNQSLAKNAKYKLTKRHIVNERARLGQQLAKVNDRLIAIGMGKAEATAPQVAALKAIQSKLLSDISPEDLLDATDETKTREELAEEMAEALTTNNCIYLADVIKHNIEAAQKARDYLVNNIPSNVKQIVND